MRRLRAGEWLAAAGGLALLVALNLGWYLPVTVMFPDLFPGSGLTGFESFSVLDVYLVLVALMGLGLAFAQATQRGPALPVAAAVMTVVPALVAVLLVAYRIANQPGPNDSVDVLAGAWIGLAAAAAVLVGAWLSIGAERVPGEGPPADVEMRPPPRIAPDAQP